jgi:hypothetical protein
VDQQPQAELQVGAVQSQQLLPEKREKGKAQELLSVMLFVFDVTNCRYSAL